VSNISSSKIFSKKIYILTILFFRQIHFTVASSDELSHTLKPVKLFFISEKCTTFALALVLVHDFS